MKKKLLLFILILLIPVVAWASGRIVFMAPGVSGDCLYSDDFDRANETPIAAPWINTRNGLDISTNRLTGTAEYNCCCSYYDGVVADNQYSQVVILDFSGGNIGPAVRMSTSTGNGYFAAIDDATHVSFWEVLNGVLSRLGEQIVGTYAADDVLRLTANGSTLELFVNGVSQGTRTDDTYSSGKVGVMTDNVDDDAFVDDFCGGDL